MPSREEIVEDDVETELQPARAAALANKINGRAGEDGFDMRITVCRKIVIRAVGEAWIWASVFV